MNRCEN